MSFQPALPLSGLAGWSFLERTRGRQQQAFNASSVMQRDTTYFRENIASVRTAEDLVADRRLLRVALGAFGLGDDIDNRYFIRKILEGGTLDPDSLANRLADKRYHAFAKVFGFGDFATANTQLADFPDRIITAYQNREFEVRIGEQDPDMRLALSVERELGQILDRKTTDDGYWYFVMGTPPLRKVFETALGLPSTTAGLELDQQLRLFRERSERVFGNGEVSQFADPEKRDQLVRRFLVLSESQAQPSMLSPGYAALALLQGSASDPLGTFS